MLQKNSTASGHNGPGEVFSAQTDFSLFRMDLPREGVRQKRRPVITLSTAPSTRGKRLDSIQSHPEIAGNMYMQNNHSQVRYSPPPRPPLLMMESSSMYSDSSLRGPEPPRSGEQSISPRVSVNSSRQRYSVSPPLQQISPGSGNHGPMFHRTLMHHTSVQFQSGQGKRPYPSGSQTSRASQRLPYPKPFLMREPNGIDQPPTTLYELPHPPRFSRGFE